LAPNKVKPHPSRCAMDNLIVWSSSTLTISRAIFAGSCVFLLIMLSGCISPLSEDSGLQSTQFALSLGQTVVARQIQTITATSIPTSVGDTPTAEQVTTPTYIQASTDTASPTPTARISATPDELIARMQSARILLYEDMVQNRDTQRFIRDTLERMGLPYKDVGDAKGSLKNELLSGNVNGAGWDLIIIAAESKPGISGEFFEYVKSALDQGASVILEIFYLDQVASGTASTILSQCGVEFQSDWRKVPPSRMVLSPLDLDHPILNAPNARLSFTNVTSYWWDPTGKVVYDIGDLMRKTPNSNASLILGTRATDKDSHATLMVCMDGRLILQTFSSHQFTFDVMSPLWENYIFNALRSRFKNAD